MTDTRAVDELTRAVGKLAGATSELSEVVERLAGELRQVQEGPERVASERPQPRIPLFKGTDPTLAERFEDELMRRPEPVNARSR